MRGKSFLKRLELVKSDNPFIEVTESKRLEIYVIYDKKMSQSKSYYPKNGKALAAYLRTMNSKMERGEVYTFQVKQITCRHKYDGNDSQFISHTSSRWFSRREVGRKHVSVYFSHKINGQVMSKSLSTTVEN